MNDFILIEYSNSVDFGDILYQNTFENRIYLDADVSKPEYELLENGITNGDGEFEPTMQKWSKKYSIRFYAQEFLVDALTLMALHDQIYITLRNGESSQATDIEVDYEWDNTIECWAEVTITFATEYIIRKSCDENMNAECEEAVIATDSTYASLPYDADDGSTGQDMWEQNGSLAPGGTVAFFYTGLEGGDSVYTGSPLGFYRYNGDTKSWDLIEMEDGQLGETGLTDCLYLIKAGDYFYKIPFIRSVLDEGSGDAKISAYSYGMEQTFFQVECDDGGGYDDVGDPQLASAFENGFTVSPGAGNFDFKIRWYTHSCDYGDSNVVNEDIT